MYVLNYSDYSIFTYVNYNYNQFFDIYNTKNNKFLFNSKQILNKNDTYLKLKNNFTEEINSYLSEIIINKIIAYNISIFDKNNFIFNDICKNFTIQNIDIPLKERRQILFLGHKAKEIICNDINCDIESAYFNIFIGECNCRVNYNMTNDINNSLIKKETTNNITYEEYLKYINSKPNINSFLNLKCAKESFNSTNLENSDIFIISIIMIIIYIILLIIYVIIYQNNKLEKVMKLNPPKIQKFNISEDLEEEEEKEQNEESKNKKEQEIIQIENKNKKNEYEKEQRETKIILVDNMIGKINKIPRTKHSISNKKNNRIIIPPIVIKHNNNNINLNSEENKLETEQNVIKFKQSKRNYKTGFSPTGNLETNDVNYKKKDNLKSKEDNNSIILKNYFVLERNKDFFYYYWKLLSLKQSVINLFSFVKYLKAQELYVHFLVKTIKIITYLLLNIFFNSFHLEQEYFRKKFEYFNHKYEIINTIKNISLSERFSYSFQHTIKVGIISFIICSIIQFFVDYFFFNSKNKLVKLKQESNNDNRNIIIFLNEHYYNKYYLIFFSLNLITIVFICYTLITFNQIYKGGLPDLFAAMIWTFIFLQFFPFINCIIFAFIIKEGMKHKIDCLIKVGEFFYF